ncbi:MAG: alpha/beta hydrolase [Rhizomicrobium sp.]|nr:alpha/beta hydrolase [Rhizomicrobium sp.]
MTNRRGFLKFGGAAAVASAFGGLAVAAPNAAPAIDPLTLVDPELRPAALAMRANTGFPPLSRETLPLIRTKIAAMSAKPLDSVGVSEQQIGNAADVHIYIVNAQAGAARPGIVYMHGGGFVFGDAKSNLRELQTLAIDLDCVIISVDYRLAPETIYAGSIEDNYAALVWTHNHASALGIDPARIAVMGESAGGGHAALLAITARDRGEVPVLFQMLIYPMLDDRTASSRPVAPHLGTFVWAADANRFAWASFLGRPPGGRDVPISAVPARNLNLGGLPPAFIGVGTLDLFVEEDIEYARRLAIAGVAVELEVVPGAYHGFDHNESAAIAMRFNLAKRDALRRAFARSGSLRTGH